MAENSNIEWTDHTVNLWWGCSKVHTGCKNCYADVFSTNRLGEDLWGINKKRKRIKSAWSDLTKYERKATKEGKKFKIFLGSMMDIFEDSKWLTEPVIERGKYGDSTGYLRHELFEDIIAGMYPNLIFLFLTKRPENISLYAPSKLLLCKNVWFGTSVSDQATCSYGKELVEQVGHERTFISMEPQVGPIEWESWMDEIGWIIQGGESGNGKRPFDIKWAESMSRDCYMAGTPYFFKQIDKVQEIPSHLKIRQFPKF